MIRGAFVATFAAALLVGSSLLAPARAANEMPEVWFESGRVAVARARALETAPDRHAKNVIVFLGDGMGMSTVTAARILQGQLAGQPGEENTLSFERFPHLALVKTYNTNQQTPDSAGTMTAILSGAKTRAGVIGVDASVPRKDFAAVRGHELPTLVEQAEDRGLSTGLVTTARLTHATPAAAYAHSPEREWEGDARQSQEANRAGFPDIARQLLEFDHGDGIEVALGGGRGYFLPEGTPDPEYPEKTGTRLDGRNLTDEWRQGRPNARYVWNRHQLETVGPETKHLLGLFEIRHMRFEFARERDPGGEPSLSEMTAKALEILERNSSGYVLVVEGGRIDHGHHAGNAYRALTETLEFANAVQTAVDRTDPDETLIVVTADHGHVFTIAGNPTRGNDILGRVVGNDEFGEPRTEPARDSRGDAYTTLGYQNGPGRVVRWAVWPAEVTGLKGFWLYLRASFGFLQRRPDSDRVDTTDPDYLQWAATPKRAETHSGEDVAAYATGPGAFLFHGVQEQSYLYHAVVEALGWTSTSAAP